MNKKIGVVGLGVFFFFNTALGKERPEKDTEAPFEWLAKAGEEGEFHPKARAEREVHCKGKPYALHLEGDPSKPESMRALVDCHDGEGLQKPCHGKSYLVILNLQPGPNEPPATVQCQIESEEAKRTSLCNWMPRLLRTLFCHL